MKTYKFYVEILPEYDAGITGFSETVSVSIEGDVYGEDKKFETFLVDSLKGWYDTTRVYPVCKDCNGTGHKNIGSDNEPIYNAFEDCEKCHGFGY